MLWFELQLVKAVGRQEERVWSWKLLSGASPPVSTHQAAHNGQEDGDGGRIADKLCDNGYQDACQQSHSP